MNALPTITTMCYPCSPSYLTSLLLIRFQLQQRTQMTTPTRMKMPMRMKVKAKALLKAKRAWTFPDGKCPRPPYPPSLPSRPSPSSPTGLFKLGTSVTNLQIKWRPLCCASILLTRPFKAEFVCSRTFKSPAGSISLTFPAPRRRFRPGSGPCSRSMSRARSPLRPGSSSRPRRPARTRPGWCRTPRGSRHRPRTARPERTELVVTRGKKKQI